MRVLRYKSLDHYSSESSSQPIIFVAGKVSENGASRKWWIQIHLLGTPSADD